MAVFGLAGGSLGTHIHASAQTVVPMPSSLTFQQAATTPTVHLTVDMALRDAAACTAGDQILIHAAAGGVGLAALQQASMMGCAILATAGSASKRGLLRSKGVQHVVNSRDTSFVTELCQRQDATAGVDVVLNSLTTPGAVAGSLAGVGVGGAFLEISKRDIWSPARLAQDRPDICYTLLALDFLPASALQSGLLRMSTALAEGKLQPLPQAVHDMHNAHAALRQMSQAKHVGKVVVMQAHNSIGLDTASSTSGGVMVTGGMGSLGTAVAAWLSQKDVPHVHLTGRTGKLSKEVMQALSDRHHSLSLTELTAHLADASSSEDARALLGSAPGLQGIMHASGVLADATFSNQSLQSLRRVFAPKTSSAQKLHSTIQQAPLAFEVLFSSVTALLGGMGQANYAAANAALDSMAGQWQGEGRGGVSSIQWGGWAGGGMAGADPTTASRLARMGMPLINPQQGLAALGAMLRSALPPAQLTMVPFNWPRFLSSSSQAASVGMFDDFISQAKAGNPPQHPQAAFSATANSTSPISSNAATAASSLTGLSSEDRLKRLTGQVVTAVTSVLGSAVSASEPLMASGLDSLVRLATAVHCCCCTRCCCY